MYRAEILADSAAPGGGRLTTFLIEFPRVVLAEVVTHRRVADAWGDWPVVERTTTPAVSKSSASGRAVPHARVLAAVRADPYVPAFTAAAGGMQGPPLAGAAAAAAEAVWLAARSAAVGAAAALDRLGVHKQDSNRLLEPWQWVTQVVTSAAWDHFFSLRCDEAACPPFRRVARLMYLVRRRAPPPRPLSPGEWHAPFLAGDPPPVWRPPAGGVADPAADLPAPLRLSVARCAWVSYAAHGRATDADVAAARTVARLAAARPIHASPFEHQATPLADGGGGSNLGPGWLQLRKLLPAERCDVYAPPEADVRAWPEYQEVGGDG